MRFTRQDHHFPIWPQKGESFDAAAARVKAQKFAIEDDLLYAALMWTTDIGNGQQMSGVWESKHSTGYVLLTFLVRQALGLYRFPYCEDRILSGYMPNESRVNFAKLIQMLSPDRLHKLVEETRALYAHTQKHLAEAGLKTMTLGRRLYCETETNLTRADYGHMFVALWQSAKTLGVTEFEIEMDSLNAFGDDGGYPHYPIAMQLDVPATDVLYCTNLVANRKYPDGNHLVRGAGETGEWQVINRSPTGVVRIPVDAIQIDEEKLQPWDRYTNPLHARSFLERYTPVYVEPTKGRIGSNRYTGKGYTHTTWGRICSAWGMLRGRFD
ncbi:hypothetical protein [Burkholderia vietnamiensis]|uniref:hypothetical protein n=1 Tax=Burkholderia vietnamiensis TaxID=60552 RepID=UPI0015905126|nr:hypothetical protein [Burkholderia vietnamiensis]